MMCIRQWLRHDDWRIEGFSVEGLTSVLTGLFSALSDDGSIHIECRQVDDPEDGTAIIAIENGIEFKILWVVAQGIVVGEKVYAVHNPQALVEGIKAAVDAFGLQFPPSASRCTRYTTVREFPDRTAQVRYYYRYERRQGKPPKVTKQHLLAITDGKVLACVQG